MKVSITDIARRYASKRQDSMMRPLDYDKMEWWNQVKIKGQVRDVIESIKELQKEAACHRQRD